MDFFSNIAVYISLILAAAVTRNLSGLAYLVENRRRVTWEWSFVAWGLTFVFFFAAGWWNLVSGWRLLHAYSISQFFFVILQPLLAYVVVALWFPRFTPKGQIDLKAHLDQVRSWVYPVAAIYVLLYPVNEVILLASKGEPVATGLDWPQVIATVAIAALVWAGAVVRRVQYDRFLVVAVTVLFVFIYAFLA